jgi:hypothetical protein
MTAHSLIFVIDVMNSNTVGELEVKVQPHLTVSFGPKRPSVHIQGCMLLTERILGTKVFTRILT